LLRRKRRSLEQVEIEASWEDSRGRRTSNRKRLVKLMERAMLQVTTGKGLITLKQCFGSGSGSSSYKIDKMNKKN